MKRVQSSAEKCGPQQNQRTSEEGLLDEESAGEKHVEDERLPDQHENLRREAHDVEDALCRNVR